MKALETLKKAVIPLTSAILGGAIVLIGLRLSPNLSQKITASNSSQKQDVAISAKGIDDIIKKQRDIQKNFDSIFDEDFFGQRDPFEQMKKMRKQMEKRMEEFNTQNDIMRNPFDSWFSDKFGGGSVEDISKREDDKYIYYDIKIENLNLTSINTKVENGHISITGTLEKKNDSKDKDNFSSHSYFKSTFSRTFPLPDGVDAGKMETVPEKDKIVLKFPKLKT